MQYLSEFRARHCPRFLRGTPEERLAESRLLQTAFWHALRYLTVGAERRSVELRLEANAEHRGLALTVAALSERPDSAFDADTLARLLPPEYAWEPSQVTGGRAVRGGEWPSGGGWHVARLMRRVQFFNLPRPSLNTFVGPEARPAGEADLEPVGDFGIAAGRQLPLLLRPGVLAQRQMHYSTLCVPLLGGLTPPPAGRGRTCQALQQAAPAVVSLVLRPIDGAQLPDDRVMANHLRDFLAPYRRDLRDTEFAQLRELAPNFDRYWLPAEFLCRMTVRVAARSPGDALAVAYALAAQFGGLAAFEIIASRNPLADIQDLVGKIPVDEMRPVRTWLEGQAVIPDDTYQGFLERMPHLYTLDEAGVLLELPFATDDAGLPGLDARAVPPFHPPAGGFTPARGRDGRPQLPPADALPIGLDRDPAADRSARWYTVPLQDLCKHTLVVGSTGSGKTVATTFLLLGLQRSEPPTPFLIVEPVKTEYFDRLCPLVPGLVRRGLGGEPDASPGPDFLTLDPLRLQPGVTVARHVSYLKSCFEAAFPLDEVLSMVLQSGLLAYYTTAVGTGAVGGCGLKLFKRGSPEVHKLRVLPAAKPDTPPTTRVYPGFEDFRQFFIGFYLKSVLDPQGKGGKASERAYEWVQIFRRRFESLQKGPFGVACARADAAVTAALSQAPPLPDALRRACYPLDDLLTKSAVIELDAVSDNEQKALLMAVLLTLIFERCQGDDMVRREELRKKRAPIPESLPLRHVIVVEEAHRLLSRGTDNRSADAGPGARAKAVGLFTDMLAEIRAYGQGLVIVEQIPTKLVPEAVKNTNLKMMMRLASADDRDYLGEAMNFTDEQKAFVATLHPGQCVAFAENLDQPALLTVPRRELWPEWGLPRAAE